LEEKNTQKRDREIEKSEENKSLKTVSLMSYVENSLNVNSLFRKAVCSLPSIKESKKMEKKLTELLQTHINQYETREIDKKEAT
jgi:hypothetical protein